MAKLHLLKKKDKKKPAKEPAKPADPTDFSLFRMGKRFADMMNGRKSKRRD